MAVLAGRVAVVTGASAGIGAGLAAMLAAEGATVVLAARRERELAATGRIVRGVPADRWHAATQAPAGTRSANRTAKFRRGPDTAC